MKQAILAMTPPNKRRRIQIGRGENATLSPELKALLESSEKTKRQPAQPNATGTVTEGSPSQPQLTARL